MGRRAGSEFVDKLGVLSRALRAALGEAYASLGLGQTQGKFLRHIGRNSRISQADLARATATDPALTGRVLETLIARGWVRRTRSAEDRRQYLLELTTSGQRVRDRVDAARSLLAEHVGSALNKRDLADFDRIAEKIRAALER
jgi:DNA-binding MarR family transcriptional regulator